MRNGVQYQAPVRVGFTADDPDLIIRAVTNQTGYARAPRLFLEEDLQDGRFEAVQPDDPPQNKDIFAVYPSRHSFDKRHELVINSLVAHLEALHVASIARRPPPTAIMA